MCGKTSGSSVAAASVNPHGVFGRPAAPRHTRHRHRRGHPDPTCRSGKLRPALLKYSHHSETTEHLWHPIPRTLRLAKPFQGTCGRDTCERPAGLRAKRTKHFRRPVGGAMRARNEPLTKIPLDLYCLLHRWYCCMVHRLLKSRNAPARRFMRASYQRR